MTICPFCKKAVVNPDGGPCPSCGKADPNFRKASPVSAEGGGDSWDELDIQHGSGSAVATGPSSYSGGSMGGFGDDDSGGPGPSLELDGPARSLPPNQAPQPQPSHPPNSGQQQQQQQQQRGVGASGGYPKYADSMPQPLPARSGRPSSDPQMHQQHQQSTPNMTPPPSQPMVGAQQPQFSQFSQPPLPPLGQPDPAAMIARYPAPPAKVWESPLYAMRVLWRQFELRQDIASLKKRRSPDVPLYERALKTHHSTHFMIGLAISFAALTVATFLFFLPVILRFVRDSD